MHIKLSYCWKGKGKDTPSDNVTVHMNWKRTYFILPFWENNY